MDRHIVALWTMIALAFLYIALILRELDTAAFVAQCHSRRLKAVENDGAADAATHSASVVETGANDANSAATGDNQAAGEAVRDEPTGSTDAPIRASKRKR